MNEELLEKKEQFENENNIKYNKEGYYIKNKNFSLRKPKITVITPVYNAEKYLKKTIDSVINQSFDFDKIEYILVDDGSTDSSREILFEYANKHKNIIIVFLKENTGTPAMPRNLGIKLSRSKYITFLDADDWFAKDGLNAMYTALEKSGDDYVVGKTIQVESDKTKIIGEYESYTERRNISPYSIPHIFHHLGPRARMIKSSLIKEHNIQFPEMKFAEDKQFFIDVLVNCKSISTTTNVIYYLNRLSDNDSSLTKQTDVMQKMDSNIKVIKHVINKKLNSNKEKMILNRLYEFDSITRLFDRQHFLKSKDKKAYYKKFQEVLDTTKELNYDISENFFNPINKVAFQLFIEERYQDLTKLFKWNKKEKVKKYIIKDNLPYLIAPFEDEKYKYIRTPMLAVYHNRYHENGNVILEMQVFGDYIKNINDLIIRDRENVLNEHSFPIKLNKDGKIKVAIDENILNDLTSSSYAVFLRFNGYEKINIRINNFSFYTTVNSNLGLKIN